MKRRVELVYDNDCPNVDAARAQLRQALVEFRVPVEWQEWDRESADAPAYVKQYGSPTILIDGRDVAGTGTEAESNCCRVYAGADGRLQGVPSVEEIQAALRHQDERGCCSE